MGSLSINGKSTSDVSEIYSFTLNSIVNGNYDNIICEIYPPDSSFSEHRMFCYINKNNSRKIFESIANDDNSQEKFFINITNYDFNLLDCSSHNKLVYFKGINLEYTESFININFYGKISGTTKEERFLIMLDEPNYSNIICLVPSSEKKSEDIFIECKYDIKKFPLVKTDKIKMPNVFPIVQDYSLSNWDFINRTLYIGYQHQNYSISFIASSYINAICYKTGYNVFSAKGSIKLNDNYNSVINGQIFEFNNYAIIDSTYANISCKIFPIYSINDEYQMDCYTNGKSIGRLFPTIISENNIHEFIFIDSLNEFSLQNCAKEIKKTINFQRYSQPKCLENGSSLMLTFTAYISGFSVEENIKLDASTSNDGIDIDLYMNCIIPFSKNGENNAEINCILDTKKFPLKNNNNIYLPYSFPYINNCEISNWNKIPKTYYSVQCYHPYEIIFSDFKNVELNCKSENEAIISIIGLRKSATNGRLISSQESYNFTLSVIMYNYIEIQEVNCELYSQDGNSIYSQMDCNFQVGKFFKLYGTVIQDKISPKYIFIDKIKSYIYINDCSGYNKFINFDGNLEIKTNLESSQLQLFLYSQTIHFEKEETLRLNLIYPEYSYIDCVIPPSKSNNNTYITCLLDTNKFPLTKEDNIILPLELKVDNCSTTKWKKIKKEWANIDCTPNHTNIFYPFEEQNITTKCDSKGNNIITIYGSINSNQTNTKYNFDILGMVDSQYKSINCNLNIKEENNEIICTTKGKNSTQIFQTMGLDKKKDNNILLKVQNYLNYDLNECHVSSSNSSTFTIIMTVGSILIFLIIAFVLFTIIRKKRKEAKPDAKLKTLINEISELQEQ